MKDITQINSMLISLLVGIIGFVMGFIVRKLLSRRQLHSAERAAKTIISDAQKEATNKKKEGELSAKDEFHKMRLKFDNETRDRRHELMTLERRVIQREENLDRKVDLLEKKQRDINRREQFLNNKANQLMGKENQLN